MTATELLAVYMLYVYSCCGNINTFCQFDFQKDANVLCNG